MAYEDINVDVRPLPVDKMITMGDAFLASRYARLVVLEAQLSERGAAVRELQQTLDNNYAFVKRSLEEVELAQAIAADDVVRVVCPDCDGTGQKAVNVLSGRLEREGSAFEGVGKAQPPPVNPRNQCGKCAGVKWILMPRYKG